MFRNRIEAGRLLGQRLRMFANLNPVVLGLPRGGLPVAAEVARILNAPLDLIVVRKLGLPFHPEYAMGALGEGDVCIVDWRVVADAGVSAGQLEQVIDRERQALQRKTHRFRGSAVPRLDLTGRTVIIVDDGIATGSTVTAATRVARDLGASRVVLATPVAPEETIDRLGRVADDLVVLESPPSFHSVGEAYYDFTETRDEDVISILGAMRPSPSEGVGLSRSA